MKQRRVLITGATSGIGRAFAAAIPGSGALLLTGRRQAKLDQLRRDLLRPDREVEVVAADLALPAGRDLVVDAAEAMGVDLLINNAGLGAFGPVLENDVTTERSVLEVNVVASADLTRRLLPGMLERARRSAHRAGLINLSSTLAFQPLPHMASYAASKMFILMYTQALEAELRGEPIDVLTLCPGPVRTSFGERAGFQPGNLPGAVEPEVVAREGLRALGRRSIHVVGPVSRSILGPGLFAQHAATQALGMVMRTFARGTRNTSPGRL